MFYWVLMGKGISSLRSLEQLFGYFPAQELLKNTWISGKDCWVWRITG